MNIDDFFKVWRELSSIKPDFILFVGFIFIVFKFKDVVEVFYKIKFHKSDKLKEAKILLELTGDGNSCDMKVIKSRLRGEAFSLMTNGVNSRYRNLCYYLMDLSSKYDIYEDKAIFKCIKFIENDGDNFIFATKSYNRWLRSCVLITAFMIIVLLLASGNEWGDSSGVLNFAWFMNISTAVFMTYSMYFYLCFKPDSSDIEIVNELLLKTSVSDFNEFIK